MTKTLKIAGICGSLRAGSYSRSLLGAMADLLPEGTEFNTVDISTIPHYNQDLDTADGPESVFASRALIAESDAVIITLPEFNHGIPGVLKKRLRLALPPCLHQLLYRQASPVRHNRTGPAWRCAGTGPDARNAFLHALQDAAFAGNCSHFCRPEIPGRQTG